MLPTARVVRILREKILFKHVTKKLHDKYGLWCFLKLHIFLQELFAEYQK